ncbi:iron chelate uptake ABC transporter family permease subunit [Vibrio lentus]|nr:iron chelate uptake ABC transporter family permease subunit [Vibrio lentus]
MLGISGGASLAMVIVLFFLPFASTPELFMIAAVLAHSVLPRDPGEHGQNYATNHGQVTVSGCRVRHSFRAKGDVWAFYFSDDLSLRLLLMYWLMGSLGGVTWYQHSLTLVMIPVIICCVFKAVS